MKYFLYALTFLFITLKLTHVITWSWWFVLLPIYGWIPLAIILFGVAGFLTAIGKKM